MRVTHFYHLWTGDKHHGSNWRNVAREHFDALKSAEFSGEVRVGLVGGSDERGEAAMWLDLMWPAWKAAVTADEGFEMPTLNALHQWAQDADPDAAVLYCHTKGAFQSIPGNHSWRQAMTGMLVGSWRDRAGEIAEGYDAVGLHWLTHRDWPEFIDQPGIMGGNFWWARAGYIAKLPPIGWTNRYCAEGWLGLSYPRVKCLVEGWPAYQ